MIPRLTQSACGCSLYTGCLILGWLNTISSLFAGIVISFLGPAMFSVAAQKAKAAGAEETEINNTLNAAKIYFAIILAACFFSLIINILFLMGVYKRNHCLIMPSVIIGGVGICFSLLNMIFSLFLAFTNFTYFFKFFIQLFQNALAIYLWLIIYSFYKEVKEEPTKPTNEDTLTKV